MGAHDIKLFGDAIAASRLEMRFSHVKATSLLRLAIEDLYPGRIALVSSFGADSAALLHMISESTRARRSCSSTPGSISRRRSPIAMRSSSVWA